MLSFCWHNIISLFITWSLTAEIFIIYHQYTLMLHGYRTAQRTHCALVQPTPGEILRLWDLGTRKTVLFFGASLSTKKQYSITRRAPQQSRRGTGCQLACVLSPCFSAQCYAAASLNLHECLCVWYQYLPCIVLFLALCSIAKVDWELSYKGVPKY